MLIRDNLPELGANLVAALAGLKVDNLQKESVRERESSRWSQVRLAQEHTQKKNEQFKI